jgi:hypothetical protein
MSHSLLDDSSPIRRSLNSESVSNSIRIRSKPFPSARACFESIYSAHSPFSDFYFHPVHLLIGFNSDLKLPKLQCAYINRVPDLFLRERRSRFFCKNLWSLFSRCDQSVNAFLVSNPLHFAWVQALIPKGTSNSFPHSAPLIKNSSAIFLTWERNPHVSFQLD